MKIKKSKKKTTARFAAASGDETKPTGGVAAKTFLDKDKNYLIRFIKMNSEAKIYVFSVRNQIIKNFVVVVIVHPAEKIFKLEDNSKPIVFESNDIPESFEIRLNS